MIIQAEPADLLMVRYKLYFNQQHPDPEDPWVLEYLHQHGLEPRRQLDEEHEGIPYKVWHFGQCYLGRHIDKIGELYQRGIEHTALAQRVEQLLDAAEDSAVRMALAPLDSTARHAVTTKLATQLHATARFDVTPERDLQVSIDAGVVAQAFLALQQM